MSSQPKIPTIADIRAANARIASDIIRTPCIPAPRLAEQLGLAGLSLKLESQQYTGSFKDRGALNKLKSLTPDEARRGVIAMSAGNHAQGVAYHAARLGIPATIVMPENTPFTKVERTANFGPRVLLKGGNIDESALYAREMAAQENLTFVHPYDDFDIIAGQGTAGLELAAELPATDALIVPIGGGGLIGGIAIALRALRPEIDVLGVEASLFPSMHHTLHHLAPEKGGQTLAEGIAVQSPGVINRVIAEQLVKDILLVGEDTIERAVHILVETQRLVAEGAGAAGLAALLADPERFRGKRVGLVICGGNIDSRLLAQVLMRGLMREGRMVTLRIEIADAPGVLGNVARLIGATGGNIIEIYHQRMFFDLPIKRADVDAVIETRNPAHVEEIIEKLNAAGFTARKLSGRSAEA